MNYVSVGLVTNSINPTHAVPLEFAAVLPNGQEFHCFFHQEYVKIRPSETQRIVDWEQRAKGQERLSPPGFSRKFFDFLDKNNYPSVLFTLAGKYMQQLTFPLMYGLLGDTVRWSFTHFDPCALLAQRSDDFIPSWADACKYMNADVPIHALKEARLIHAMMKEFL